MKPIAWLSTVVGTLASLTVLERGSTASRSVKVPPTSMPTVRERLEAIDFYTDRYCSRREASAVSSAIEPPKRIWPFSMI